MDSKFIVRGTDGRVDLNQSLAAFHNELNKFVSREQSDLDQIGAAVEEFWAENEALKNVSLDAIASSVFGKLQMPATTFKDTTDRIKNYIRTNTETYYVGKGKEGGVRCLARMTEEEKTKALASREKAAAKKAA
jgi:hypothetical protein